MRGHLAGITQLKRLNNSFTRVVSGSMDGTCKIWDVTSGVCTGDFGDHDDVGISRIAMNQNFLVSYSDQNETLVIRDFERGKVLIRINQFDDNILPGLSGSQRSVYSTGKFELGDIIATNEDPNTIITSESKRIRVWDLRRGIE